MHLCGQSGAIKQVTTNRISTEQQRRNQRLLLVAQAGGCVSVYTQTSKAIQESSGIITERSAR